MDVFAIGIWNYGSRLRWLNFWANFLNRCLWPFVQPFDDMIWIEDYRETQAPMKFIYYEHSGFPSVFSRFFGMESGIFDVARIWSQICNYWDYFLILKKLLSDYYHTFLQKTHAKHRTTGMETVLFCSSAGHYTVSCKDR